MEETTKSLIAESFVLANWLIELINIKRADVARETKNNPANLSQWLKGREKLLSNARKESVLEWLGLIDGKLDAKYVHRWEVGNDFNALRSLLQATETPATLASMILHKVDGDKSHDNRSPLLLEFDRAGTPVLIIVRRPLSSGKHPLKLDPSSLGFGRPGPDVHIPPAMLDANNLEVSTSEFCKNLSKQIKSDNHDSLIDAKMGNWEENRPPDQLVLEMQSTILSLRNDLADLRANDAGLRSLIRKALNELRKINPEHPLLDEKIRQGIYQEFYQSEIQKFRN